MGRPRGSISKKTMMLEEKLAKHNMDPIAGLYACLEELQAVKCYAPCDKIMNAQAKANIWIDLMSYIYPKRKALDISYQVQEQQHVVWDFRYGDEDPNIIDAQTNSTTAALPAPEQEI